MLDRRPRNRIGRSGVGWKILCAHQADLLPLPVPSESDDGRSFVLDSGVDRAPDRQGAVSDYGALVRVDAGVVGR